MSQAAQAWQGELRALEHRAEAALRRKGLVYSRRGTTRALARPPYGVPLDARRLSDWIPTDPNEISKVPRFASVDVVWALVRLWSSWAGENPDRRYWSDLLEAAQRPRARRHVRLPDQEPLQPAPRTDASRGPRDAEWTQLVQTHLAWECICPDYTPQAVLFKQQAIEVARRLAGTHDTAENMFKDPWRDPQFAERFTKRINQVLSRCLSRKEIFTPAEAALLALTPLLHHTHMVWAAAKLSRVGPMDLRLDDSDDRARGRYQEFFRQSRYEWLVRRAKQGDLPGRKRAGEEICGWLFRRWLVEQTETLEECSSRAVLAEADVLGGDMGGLLEHDRVAAVLRALRLDPDRLTSDDPHLSQLQAQDVQYFEECRSEQPIRQRLLCFVLATARGMTIDLMDLPPVVVEHLGIPDPAVDLDELRMTVAGAVWKTTGKQGIQLKADCFHQAVLEALREHAEGVDVLLRAVNRAVGEGDETLEPLTRLWTHARADWVKPARGDDGKELFDPEIIRFRLDERRVRELLMGVNLYGDRALAIRELYQNALDACRLRQAYELEHSRSPYGRRFDYNGRIEFTQGRDEHDRYFLECRDNGVGMGDKELRGVFSQAGARFTEQGSFWEDQARWKKLDPPVELYPNSRFGIGVFSYFMLADEIEVTTRRMDRHGGWPGQEYTVIISGPGHLFHINKTSRMEDTPGTRVRLYLRDEDAPSCVKELRRLLGVADFLTTAKHKDQQETWAPGRLQLRRRLAPEQVGLNVCGTVVPWTEEGQDAPVVWWCEHGGALLVDGLLVSPAPTVRQGVLAGRRGILAGIGSDSLRGVVVNLTGKCAPRLSVDRTQVLDDVSQNIEELLASAARTFVASHEELPNFRWISAVADYSPKVADIVTEAAIAAGRPMELNRRTIDMTVAGCFPQDAVLIDEDKFRDFVGGLYSNLMSSMEGNPPDYVTLWRLLAHQPSDELEALTRFAPELADMEHILAALPSDIGLIADVWGRRHWPDPYERECPGRILWTAMHAGISPRQAALRAAAIGLRWLRPELFPEEREPDPISLALLSESLNDTIPVWLSTRWPVSPGHLIGAHYRFDIDITDAVDRLAHYGFGVPNFGQLSDPELEDLVLLSVGLDSDYPWVNSTEPVPVGHILRVSLHLGMPVADVTQRLAAYGLDAEWEHLPDLSNPDDLRLLSLGIDNTWPWVDHTEPVPPGHLVNAVIALNLPLSEVAARCADLGLQLPGELSDPHAVNDREWLTDRKLLSQNLNGTLPWLDADQPVPLRHLILTRRILKISMPEAAERLARYGLRVPSEIPSDTLHDLDPELLSERIDATFPWLDTNQPIPLHHILRAAQKLPISIAQVVTRLRELGMNVPDLAATIRAAMRDIPRKE